MGVTLVYKVKDTNSEGSQGERGGTVPSSPDSEVWESVMSCPSRVRGEAPVENGFYSNLASADRHC